jgi:hypothetical protein
MAEISMSKEIYDFQACVARKALWIDHGRSMKYGDVDSLIDAYLNA